MKRASYLSGQSGNRTARTARSSYLTGMLKVSVPTAVRLINTQMAVRSVEESFNYEKSRIHIVQSVGQNQ